jgi:hypothetical protein
METLTLERISSLGSITYLFGNSKADIRFLLYSPKSLLCFWATDTTNWQVLAHRIFVSYPEDFSV